MAKNKVTKEMAKARGFFRLQIRDEDGKVAGDTGWRENQVTNEGFQDYLCKTLGGMAGSKTIAYAMLGTGTAPASNATALDGEITDVEASRCAVTPTVVSSKTLQLAFTLASSVYTAAKTIQNVGLINHSSTATAGTIFAGNTYTTSARNAKALTSVMKFIKFLKFRETLNFIKTILSETQKWGRAETIIETPAFAG